MGERTSRHRHAGWHWTYKCTFAAHVKVSKKKAKKYRNQHSPPRARVTVAKDAKHHSSLPRLFVPLARVRSDVNRDEDFSSSPSSNASPIRMTTTSKFFQERRELNLEFRVLEEKFKKRKRERPFFYPSSRHTKKTLRFEENHHSSSSLSLFSLRPTTKPPKFRRRRDSLVAWGEILKRALRADCCTCFFEERKI